MQTNYVLSNLEHLNNWTGIIKYWCRERENLSEQTSLMKNLSGSRRTNSKLNQQMPPGALGILALETSVQMASAITTAQQNDNNL